MKTFLRYLLFQIPEWILLGLFLWLLVDRTAVPLWTSTGLFILWIIKDFAIYPLVRGAYEQNAKTGTDQLIGAKGLTQEELNPAGYIKINGELWRARVRPDARAVLPHRIVEVENADGLTLIVREEAVHS